VYQVIFERNEIFNENAIYGYAGLDYKYVREEEERVIDTYRDREPAIERAAEFFM
jgi:hypothetical protein